MKPISSIKLFCILKIFLFGIVLIIIAPDALQASTGDRYKRPPNRFKHKLYRSNLFLEGKIYYGFIANHHIGMEIYDSHFPAIELSLGKATYGKQFWEQIYNYPFIGISFYRSGLGTSPYLGIANALFPYINFPIIKTKNLTLGFRLGAGIGYLSKKFDRLENYKHLAIGSHFNFAGNLMMELNCRLNDYYMLTAGIALIHFSNGSLKLPNYGLNIPSLSIGIARFLSKQNPYIQQKLYSPTKPFDYDVHHIIELNLTCVLGFKDLEAIFGKNFFVYSLFGNVFKHLSYKSKLGAGFDISYDGSDEKMLEKNHTPVDNKLSLIKTGFNIAYELAMGKLAFDLNYGMYASGKDQSDGSVYQKISLKYEFSKNLYANITLKVHWGRADFIGWGLGYKIKWSY